ncbi:MAG: HEPN domain-containing protein [Saprospiraceae bacterium]|jgi:HEPN domain-containing protein|nr:HEPN domain-containing protein [Saprospiraceae bacterium]
MTKQEYIEYWKAVSEKDWTAAMHLYESGDYLHSLFFAHLVLEKLLKACWVKDNSLDIPPKTHNLLVLLSQTTLSPSVEQLRLLSQMNQFQLDSRYPDYKLNMYRIATKSYTGELLQEIENTIKWLHNSLS